MKYFIIGLHASGKQEIIDMLRELGISCGKLFSNMEEPSPNIYNSLNYELYSNKDVMDIFENNAYVFIQEMKGNQYEKDHFNLKRVCVRLFHYRLPAWIYWSL